jgi:hypothetical protein
VATEILSAIDLQVIPFNSFVREIGLTLDRLPFHQYVTQLLGETGGVTRDYWYRLLAEFEQEADIRDLRGTRRASVL